jgi:hypothetical protein
MIIKDRVVGFEPMTSQQCHSFLQAIRCLPLKEKLLKEKNWSNIRRSIFHAPQPQVHNDKACEKIQILSICSILFSGLNVEPLKEF